VLGGEGRTSTRRDVAVINMARPSGSAPAPRLAAFCIPGQFDLHRRCPVLTTVYSITVPEAGIVDVQRDEEYARSETETGQAGPCSQRTRRVLARELRESARSACASGRRHRILIASLLDGRYGRGELSRGPLVSRHDFSGGMLKVSQSRASRHRRGRGVPRNRRRACRSVAGAVDGGLARSASQPRLVNFVSGIGKSSASGGRTDPRRRPPAAAATIHAAAKPAMDTNSRGSAFPGRVVAGMVR
jgi:hypothetical protein